MVVALVLVLDEFMARVAQFWCGVRGNHKWRNCKWDYSGNQMCENCSKVRRLD